MTESVRVRPVPGAFGRRPFLRAASAALVVAMQPFGTPAAGAEPHGAEQWIANHAATRLIGPDGEPIAWLPRWTRMRVLRSLLGWIEVWVPRLGLVGRVAPSAVGPVPAPGPDDLAAERQEPSGPPTVAAIGLPGRLVGGANLRLWPAARTDTLLRALPHNAALRVIDSVEGDDGEEWYRVDLLDGASSEALGTGYVHHSLVRLPRLRLPEAADAPDRLGRWLEADLEEPAMFTAFEGGAPVWSSLTLKGRAASRTHPGLHRILRRVESETMNSESLSPPVSRSAPGGYYLKNVLWTQYFYWDGESIHYNYWSSNWGYTGSNGCLGLPHHEARFCWDFAEVGTPVRIFG